MSLDIVIAPAWQVAGAEAPAGALAPSGTVVMAGGSDYDEVNAESTVPAPVEVRETENHNGSVWCRLKNKKGLPCRGFSSGEDGLCAGHRRAKLADS